MIESMLIADHGLSAATVIARAQAMGIKCVCIGLTHPPPATSTDPGTDAARMADDTVLLADLAELHDPTAVVRAAEAAAVEAVHPGRGPLRSSTALAEQARAAGLVPVTARTTTTTTTTTAPATTAWAELERELERDLRRAGVPADFDSDQAGSASYYMLAAPSGMRVLGAVGRDGDLVVAPAPWPTDGEPGLAHAVVSVLGGHGLLSVGVRAGHVVGIDLGLPEHFPAWELVTGLDLIAMQIEAACGAAPAVEPVAHGAAVMGTGVDVTPDVRVLLDAAEPGLRLDTVPLAGRGHGAVVRASAWAQDRAGAEQILVRYRRRLR